MQKIELRPNFYYIGVVDHSLKLFDVAILTEDGTSYNSYLLKTKEGVVLFEGCRREYQDEYFKHIEEIASLEEVRYLFVSHTEPDHSGSIKELLSRNPNITIVASAAALKNLDAILRVPFNRISMNPASSLSFGGYTFSFVSGSFLHWPDVMFTYISELKVLVSCDAFGAHFASDAILLSKEKNKEGYVAALRYYFACIMGAFAKFVTAACERAEKLDTEMICPGHGPIIDEGVQKQIGLYRSLADEWTPVNDPNKVTIVYASAYGYTKEMASYLAKRFEKDGKTVHLYEIDALNYGAQKEDILSSILKSGTLLLGSPTIAGDAVCLFYELLSHVLTTTGPGKKASVFGDYGWSGEAIKNLSERLTQLRFNVLPGFRYAFALDKDGETALSAYYDSLK